MIVQSASGGKVYSRATYVYGAGLLGALGLAVVLTGPLQQGRLAPVLPYGLVAVGIILALALSQPRILFVVGFLLLGVVSTEPAPVDVVFAILMLVTVLSGRVSPRIPAPIQIIIGLTVAVTLLSTVNAADTGRALQYQFVTFYLLALAVWLTWVFTDARATRIAVRAYLGVAAVSSVLVLLALYAGLPGGDVLLYASTRGQGLFKDPNVFAAFLVPAAAVALEEIGRPRLLPWRRSITVLLFVVIAAGVVVAFSRAGWLGLAIASATVITVEAFRRGGSRVALRSLSGLVIAGVVGLGLLAATGSLAFFRERSRIASYDEQRFGAQDAAFDRIGAHVFGHGPGQVESTLDISTHSLFARAAFEQGAPGLVLLLLLLFGTLYYAVILAQGDGSVHGVGSAALLGSWVGLIANGAFIDAIHWRHFYVLAALIWCGAMLQSDERRLKRMPVHAERRASGIETR